MDHRKIPIGFGLELAQNGTAMSKYAALNEEEQRDILEQAHNVSSREEMRRLVSEIGVDNPL